MSRIAYPDEWPQSACDELDEMFVRARAEGKWFFHGGMHLGPLWFSPDELQAEQEKGRCIFGPVNWSLRDPLERLISLEDAAKNAQREAKDFLKRMIVAGAIEPFR